MEHPAAVGQMDSVRLDAHGASRNLHRAGHFRALVLEKPLISKKRAEKFSQFRILLYLCAPLQQRGVYHRHKIVSLTFKDISRK
jgi:hypothetical protein